VPVSALHQYLKGVCGSFAHPARFVADRARPDPHSVTEAAGSRRPDPLAYVWVGEGQ
jgi:hypothetical protein